MGSDLSRVIECWDAWENTDNGLNVPQVCCARTQSLRKETKQNVVICRSYRFATGWNVNMFGWIESNATLNKQQVPWHYNSQVYNMLCLLFSNYYKISIDTYKLQQGFRVTSH